MSSHACLVCLQGTNARPGSPGSWSVFDWIPAEENWPTYRVICTDCQSQILRYLLSGYLPELVSRLEAADRAGHAPELSPDSPRETRVLGLLRFCEVLRRAGAVADG